MLFSVKSDYVEFEERRKNCLFFLNYEPTNIVLATNLVVWEPDGFFEAHFQTINFHVISGKYETQT